MKRCKAKSCRQKFEPWNSLQEACSVTCALEIASEKAEKKARKDRARARKERREFNRRDIQWQHKQCQKVFNRMRVLEEIKWFRDRGLEPECISCGKNGDFCCGHFKTVGAQSGLRYDRINTYLQCNTSCNKGLSGNLNGNKHSRGYRQGLIERFGPEKAEEIERYCDSKTQPVKWDWQEMERWRREWSARIRELESELEGKAA